jgi:hypothetical protein
VYTHITNKQLKEIHKSFHHRRKGLWTTPWCEF